MESQNAKKPETGKKAGCLQRADAEAFLSYRRLTAKNAAILVLLVFLLFGVAVFAASLKWKTRTFALAAVLTAFIPVAFFISAYRKTEAGRRQFAFFKHLAFRVDAGVYDEIAMRAKAFAPKERIAFGSVAVVLLAAVVLRLGLNRYMSAAAMAILLVISGLLLAPATWAILTAKTYRILLQKGEYSAQNKASRSNSVHFAILCGVILLIAVIVIQRLTKYSNLAVLAAVILFFALYLWKRIVMTRKYAYLKKLNDAVRTPASTVPEKAEQADSDND